MIIITRGVNNNVWWCKSGPNPTIDYRSLGERGVQPKSTQKALWEWPGGMGGIWIENRKRGRLFCAEEQNEDGLLGWCPGKMASHLNLSSMWRREKTRREALRSIRLTWCVEHGTVGKTMGWGKSWQLGRLKVRPERFQSLASWMHQAYSVRALGSSLSSVWHTLPTHCSFFPPWLNSTHPSGLSITVIFSKKSALTFQLKLDSSAIVSHLIQLFSFLVLITDYNDIFMSVTICLTSTSPISWHKLHEVRDFIHLVP